MTCCVLVPLNQVGVVMGNWIRILAISSVLLGGCTSFSEYLHNGFKVGPNYATPPAPVKQAWIDVADKRVRADSDDLSAWWTVFGDPVLNKLVLCHSQKFGLA